MHIAQALIWLGLFPVGVDRACVLFIDHQSVQTVLTDPFAPRYLYYYILFNSHVFFVIDGWIYFNDRSLSRMEMEMKVWNRMLQDQEGA